MSREQSNGDLLPYREVDRALKPKLPLLAGLMGVSPQHALGSLLEFWDLCADRRELERIASEALERGEQPELVLAKEDVELRFELASGRKVEPLKLVMLGFLEPRPGEHFRVRGMSRDFKPILRTLKNRANASLGGHRSAEVRAADHGTAQPKGGKGFKGGSGAASGSAQATSEARPKHHPKQSRSDDGTATEPEPNSSGQRSAVSGLTSSSYEDDGPAAPPSPAVGFYERFQATRQGLGWAHEEPPTRAELEDFFAGVAEQLDDTLEGAKAALEVACRGYAKDPYWLQRALPWAGFVKQWRRYVRSGLGDPEAAA